MNKDITIKINKKTLLIIVIVLLCFIIGVAGSIAWLTSKTTTVNNTFTAGNVSISLDEAKTDTYGVEGSGRVTSNSYKLVPGTTYVKDPTITVASGSEPCYIFAKVVNNVGSTLTYTINSGWYLLEGSAAGTAVYYYRNQATAGNSYELFPSVTLASSVTSTTTKTVTVTGYAIQARGFSCSNNTNAAVCWDILEALG